MSKTPLPEAMDQFQTTQLIKKKTVSGAVSYFGRTIALQGIGLVASAILSAVFAPSDFGIYGLVIQIIALLTFFSDIGLAAALIQHRDEPSQDDYKTAFTLQQALSWFIFLITVGIALSGAVEEKIGMAGQYILISLGLSFPLASFKTIPSIILERKLDFSRLVVPQIVEQLVFYTVLIFAALRGYGVAAYIPAIVLRSVSGVIVMYSLQSWQVQIGIVRSSLKKLLGYGVKFQLNDFLARIKDQLFFLTLGFYFPLAEFGYINWAKNWSSYPYNFTVQNVMSLTFPVFSRLQHDKQLLKKAIEKSLFFISLAIFPLLAGMSVFINPLLDVFPVYAQWKPAAQSLILFSLSIAGGALSTPLTNMLNAVGRINDTLKLMVVWTVLTWIVTPLCIWKFGFDGVAIAAFLISFTSILPLYFVNKIVSISVWSEIWRQIAAACGLVVVGLVGIEWWSQSLSWLLIGMMSSGAVYLIIMLGLGKQKLIHEFRSLKSKNSA